MNGGDTVCPGGVGRLLGVIANPDRFLVPPNSREAPVSDIDKTVRALLKSIDGPPDPGPPSWPSPVLCVLDCLLSLDRRKEGWVDQTLQRLQEPDSQYGTMGSVRSFVTAFSSPADYFVADLRDKEAKRAALLVPLLDALIDAGMDFPGQTESDRLRAWAVAASPADYSFGPFRGLGLKGFQNLRRLLGANTLVPTTETASWVGRAIGREPEATEAVHLLEKAARRLRYDLRGVPEEVWQCRIGETPKGGTH